ncbi:MAG TPA: tRNA modification GTPase [Myxococcota bacterium]|nr:tRNA modification GTPase [Myxococcota bacterium]HRY92910.1 tRNA modification GTPase [Myxococcota bacterium]HSA20903.1 tRNA modification GTPase [Myxococcota bacterium]
MILFEDTIAARATPAGVGAVAVVRLSGPGARAILEAAVRVGPKKPWEHPRRLVLSQVLDAQGRCLDQVLACFLPAPRTYTGEDMVELQGHGGEAAVGAVLGRLLELGARPALPGEFTRRAFENGRMSLDQAEAVARMVEAGSRAELLGAGRALGGELGKRLGELQEALEVALSEAEASLEFPDEEDVTRRVTVRLAPCLEALLTLDRAVRRVGDGGRPRVAVAGRPNVGKSSIINMLSGTEAALVTPQPGTTRDAVPTEVVMAGRALVLVDTAGREPEAGDHVPAGIEGSGPADEAAVRRAREQAERAELVLWVASAEPASGDTAAVRRELSAGLAWIAGLGRAGLGVANKADLLPAGIARALEEELREAGSVLLSARTGQGAEGLVARVAEELDRRQGPADGLPVSVRQAEALRRIRGALERGLENLERGAVELLAEDLREALAGVGLVRGEGIEPDSLDRIFATFCVGK